MNWRELLRNKKLLAGVGAAAALGAFVWWRGRGRGGPDVAGDDTTSEAGGRIANPGYLNTTGTDVAAWLSEYSGGLQSQMDEFLGQLDDRLDPIPTEPTKPPTVTPTPKYVNVAKGFHWPDFVKWLRLRGYDPKPYDIGFDDLYRLNPDWLAGHVKGGRVIKPGRVRIQ